MTGLAGAVMASVAAAGVTTAAVNVATAGSGGGVVAGRLRASHAANRSRNGSNNWAKPPGRYTINSSRPSLVVAVPAESSGRNAGTPITNSTPTKGPAISVAPPTTTITATSMLADAGNEAVVILENVCA